MTGTIGIVRYMGFNDIEPPPEDELFYTDEEHINDFNNNGEGFAT